MKKETIERIRKFTDDRDWDQFHTPANLAKSIVIEAAELLECFQWSDKDIDLQHVKEELADVIVYSQNLLDKLGLDVDEIVNMKMEQNEAKYPIDKAKGSAAKYDQLKSDTEIETDDIIKYTPSKVSDFDTINEATLGYYERNAVQFAVNTVAVDLHTDHHVFMKKLKADSRILDYGCGSGRDTKYFMNKGYEVDAVDASEELCKIASEYTGIFVRKMYFKQLDSINYYDGIWACASILHLSKSELSIVMNKMITALKKNGIIYASFKYGEYEGFRTGRYFTDFTEDTFKEFIKDFPKLKLEECWVSNDVRRDRCDEKWLNVILRK